MLRTDVAEDIGPPKLYIRLDEEEDELGKHITVTLIFFAQSKV